MAIILEFRRGENASARVTKHADGSFGEIIIFPGVRIDRRAPDDVPRHTTTPRKGAQRSRKKQ